MSWRKETGRVTDGGIDVIQPMQGRGQRKEVGFFEHGMVTSWRFTLGRIMVDKYW